MELLILHSSINYLPKNFEKVFTEKDFHPCKPFFLNTDILPETVTRIRTKGVFETCDFLRQTLKIIDYLLAVDGELIIEFYRASFDIGGYPLRPLNYLMNEISICFKDRFKVYKKVNADNVDYISLKKIRNALPEGDDIRKWSFGIVSDGRKNDRVLNIIDQINAFNIPEFEIFICGPSPDTILPKEVIILDDKDLYFDVRIPISQKKNRIIGAAKFNNLMILHDRISFSKNWYEKICRFGNYFDQLCCSIFDEDTKSIHINDWLSNFNDNNQFRVSKVTKLKHNEWNKHIYVDGGVMVIKKHIIINNKLNPNLHWGEMEDVNLSEKLYIDGNLINFYADAELFTQTHRIAAHKQSTNWLKVLLRPISSKQYERKFNNKILHNFRNFLNSKLGDNI